MALLSVWNYLFQPTVVLLVLPLLFVLYVLYRFFVLRSRRARLKPAAPPGPAVSGTPGAPSFRTLDRPPSLVGELLHALLVIIAIIVAVGFLLVVVPQATFDNMAQGLQARRAVVQKEQVAFLYLGDEINGSEFHIRGVVRNITDQQLERIDAVVRLYAPDGRLLQTAVVRMSKENIAPDETAEFHLMYPNYEQNIGSYSVDFMTREGGLVNYKDMRAGRGGD